MSRLTLLIAAAPPPRSRWPAAARRHENEASANRNAVAASKAENGQLTVRAQGVDLKIDLPAPLRRMADDDGNRRVRLSGRGGRGAAPRAASSPSTATTRPRPWRAGIAIRRAPPASRSPRTSAQGAAIVIAGTARNGDGLRRPPRPGRRRRHRRAGRRHRRATDGRAARRSRRRSAPISSRRRGPGSRSAMASCSSISATASRGRRCGRSARCSARSTARPRRAASPSSPCWWCARATAFRARAGGWPAAARARGYDGPWEGPEAARFIAARAGAKPLPSGSPLPGQSPRQARR